MEYHTMISSMMFSDFVNAVGSLLERGGPVLWIILGVTAWGWILVYERYLFLAWGHARRVKQWLLAGQQGPAGSTWAGRRYREALVSRAGQQLRRGLPTIKTIVTICPLLGLLGTVLGMLQVFETMAIFGTGNPRVMAAGISQATLSTMAGMVAALSLVYFPYALEQTARQVQAELGAWLQTDVPASISQEAGDAT